MMLMLMLVLLMRVLLTLSTFASPLLTNILVSVHHTFRLCAFFALAAQHSIISSLVLFCPIVLSKWARN